MANVLIEESVLQGWADTIREKTGTIDAMLPTVMLTKTQEEWGASSGGGDGEIDPVAANFIGMIERTGETITLPDGLTNIAERAFYFYKNLNLAFIPDSVTDIGDYSFYECNNLALTSLPDAVTSIGECAFYRCRKLALTRLPENLKYIYPEAFDTCESLAITTIPAKVEYIGANAFVRCYNLKTITFKGTPKNMIASNAFSTTTGLTTINVPWAEGYVKNAPWGASNVTINYNYKEG